MRRTAVIDVPRKNEDLLAWFTPEGERLWAGSDGWDPIYPDPDRTDGVGAVFVTGHSDHETTWIMVDRTPTSVRYARVTPGVSAGTVEVRVTDDTAAETVQVAVTYDLTATSPAGRELLARLEAHYEAEIKTWQRDIDVRARSRG
jgi:hypothetical protein